MILRIDMDAWTEGFKPEFLISNGGTVYEIEEYHESSATPMRFVFEVRKIGRVPIDEEIPHVKFAWYPRSKRR